MSRTVAHRQAGRTARTETIYIDGNTLRRVPAYGETEHRASRRLSDTVRKNRERSLQMNLRYVLFLSMAAVLSVLMCVTYLRLQSRCTSLQKEQTALEAQLSELKLDNDARYNRIMSSVNLEQVKEKAMNELGMVYAQASQIVTYEAPGSDYVKQYQDVPED